MQNETFLRYFQPLWYYCSNIWPFWQCIEERDEGKKKSKKKEVKNDFHSCTTNFSLEKKLFRSTLPKAEPVYLLCNFPAENDVFENCKKKKKLGLWSYSLQGQEVNQVYCENALEFIQDFFFLLGDNFFFAFFHWKRHISTTYIPLKEKEWVYNGIYLFFVKAG